MNRDQDQKSPRGEFSSSGSQLSQANGSNITLALPVVLRQVKDNVLSILLNHLTNYFSSCDDLFFDLAKKAANNKEQNLYFDSMREVRIRKNDIISLFKREYELLYKDLGKLRKSADDTRPVSSFETLDLIANDEMEQNVAISGIVGKSRATYQEELYHLTCRLDYLLHNIKVTEANNPLDPAQLCGAFSRALQPLEVDFTARIILLKQFDRVVVREFGQIYRLANELLVASGILPKIRNSINNPQHSQASAAPTHDAHVAEEKLAPTAQGSGPGEATQDQGNTYQAVNELVATMRTMGVNFPRDIRNLYRGAVPGPVLHSNDLQGFLSEQQIQMASANDSPVDLRRLIYSGLVNMGEPGKPRSLEQPDEDVINLVAMFFDFVLDDSSLPVPIQALVARLQIPVLKVALGDRSFFSNQNHPVRRFINEIATASIGWDESDKKEQDSLFQTIEQLVHKILNNFQGDTGLFEVCLEELKLRVGEDQKRSAIVEKRTSDAAQGKARMEHARQQVQKLLWNRLHDASLPAVVWELLVMDWQKLLVHTLLKYGQDCPEWVDALQLVDDLCWYSARHTDEKSRHRMVRLIPLLTARVETGFNRLSMQAETSTAKVARLSEFLESCLKGIQVPVYVSINAEHLLELGQSDDGKGKSWKDMTALERQQIKHQAITYEFLKKADEISVGSWLTYVTSETGRTTRCKLAARLDATDQMVFVNRFGFKALERSRRQFAHDMQMGQVRLLESGILFDRAMTNIVTSLKKISPPGRQVS